MKPKGMVLKHWDSLYARINMAVAHLPYSMEKLQSFLLLERPALWATHLQGITI